MGRRSQQGRGDEDNKRSEAARVSGQSVWVDYGVCMVRGSLGKSVEPRFGGGDLEPYFGPVAFEIPMGVCRELEENAYTPP